MNKRLSLGAALWICCLQYLLAEQVVSRAWLLPYSFARNYISDLGAVWCDAVVCSPWHAVMNGSFVLQGVLIGTGAMLLWPESGLAGRLAAGLLMICGAGVLVVGFFPEDTNPSVHFIGAAAHFLGAGAGFVFAGLARSRGKHRLLGWSSILVGVVVLAATLLLSQRRALAWPILDSPGMIERAASYGITLWLVSTGLMQSRRIPSLG